MRQLNEPWTCVRIKESVRDFSGSAEREGRRVALIIQMIGWSGPFLRHLADERRRISLSELSIFEKMIEKATKSYL